MPLDELLQNLVNVPSQEKYFLSLYLDLTPDRNGRRLPMVFLKSRVPELANRFPAHSPEQALLAKNLKRIQRFLEEDLEPAWKGIALFVAAPDDLLVSIPMPLPPGNALDLSSYPHLFSLVRHSDLFVTHGVVVADSRQARFFLIRLGRVDREITLSWEDKHTTRFGRMGLSLPRFQRHLKEHGKQRAKEIAENVEKAVSTDKVDRLFVVADDEMETEIRAQLPTDLKKKMTPLPSLDPHDPAHKILLAASQALRSMAREKAEALATYLLEEAEPLGQAASSPEPTLSALQNHQVERMVLDARFRATGWKCPKCSRLGSGGLPKSCPFCQGGICPTDLREEMVARAKAQRIELFFTDNYSPLMKAGGVGAFLKYKIQRAKGL